MNPLEHPLYLEDIHAVTSIDLPWGELQNKSVLITGATGMIGTFLIDVLMHKNEQEKRNIHIYAISRDVNLARERFQAYWKKELFQHVSKDVNSSMENMIEGDVDYVIHLASITHPIAYATKPIETITTNIVGLKNLLDFTVNKKARRFVFASSNEIYGENRGDVELFDEKYCGYIDCNTLRAGYSESKRFGEALCQAYRTQKHLDIAISRFTRTFGPTLLDTDTKALSQFIHKAVKGKDIVLKSEGQQRYSYTYVADAVSGLLYVLLKGVDGEAYNVADVIGDICLRELAETVAQICNQKVRYETPSDVERAGYSAATKARLNGKKLRGLGWRMQFDIPRGIQKTISLMKDCRKEAFFG